MRSRKAQSGVTIVITLVLMIVMLLGGMALARMSEVGTLAAGNAAYHDTAVQAGEVGINTAYAALVALANEEADAGSWYWSLARAEDANGLPAVDWSAAPALAVGSYEARYVAERLCNGALPLTDAARQCLHKFGNPPETFGAGRELPPSPKSKVFRLTVRITGPKDTLTFVQSLVTRG